MDDKANDSAYGQAGRAGIEITQAMKEAGARILADTYETSQWGAEITAARVFSAMLDAASRRDEDEATLERLAKRLLSTPPG